MRFKKLILIIILGRAFSSVGVCFGQEIDSVVQDKELIQRSSAWISSKNTAGLKYLSVNKFSTVATGITKNNGGFKNYETSDDAYSVNAGTESYFRLNNKVILYGAANYENFTGKNMQGSFLINPYKHPLNFVEETDTTAGTKKLETYSFSGAVSAALSSKITMGAKIDYTAADYAKLKDLRHLNRLLDANISTGMMYKINNSFELGVNYKYTRRIETIKFEVHGNTDRRYLVLVDYGNFYGRNELFGEDGLTDAKRPLVNNTHEASLQMNVNFTPETEFLSEFSLGKRVGYFGKQGAVSIIYTNHDANVYSYSGTFNLKKSVNLHSVKLNASYESLQNFENVFQRVTSSGGISTINYYGKNEVFNQRLTAVSLLYNAYLRIQKNNPQWVFSLGGDYFNREQNTVLYPFYRHQNIHCYAISASAKNNVIRQKNMLTFALHTGYGKGSGELNADRIYTSSGSNQNTPSSQSVYLNQEYEFLTSPRVHFEPLVQYSQLVKDNVAAYVKLWMRYVHAFEVNYLKPSAYNAGLSIGCYF